uniref:CYFIP-related Rac1 interactor A isoform X2 n=1 Tax=Jaculus jaculus TaxID=51337 RepID=UPI001E1B31C6|nr:CYFIP-related Rac1 interactor A isoform X2 [Jaculus jaculus]
MHQASVRTCVARRSVLGHQLVSYCYCQPSPRPQSSAPFQTCSAPAERPQEAQDPQQLCHYLEQNQAFLWEARGDFVSTADQPVPSCRRFAGMGNLLKVLTREIENYPHFFLDFENAQPTEGEREIWNQISAVLQDSESILADLQAYKGAGPEIRDAIQNPNDIQLQEKAWNAVCPLVVRLKRFYEFSIRLEKALQSLLESLTCPPYTPTQHLEREQALAKEFAEILHFTLRFDELKMRNPAIQNDFSYYRRTISRNRINNMHLDIENEVNNEMANRMSLFYAEATPMLKTLSNATMHFVSENKTLPIENTTDCLSTMTSVCKVMLETPEYRSRFTSEETLMFCMRVMVGVIILYDHVHPVGAFCKTSKIDMKGCIKVLKEQAPDSVEGLLNALRFTTKHLNDESTSKQIRAMLQ